MVESRNTLGYQQAVASVAETVRARVLGIWNGLPGYRDQDIDRFVSWVVPLVQAGQLQVANLTAAYFNSGQVDRDLVLYGRGVNPDVVYRRPAVTVYTSLAQGKTVSSAIQSGAARAADLVLTDIQMAKVRQSQQSLGEKGVQFYRRVLTGRENCALCVLASTQRYRVKDLMPIHPDCDCSVAELPEGWNPHVLDPGLVDLVYEQVKAENDGLLPNYSDYISVKMHGEYGPTLTWKGQHFTGPDDL